MGVFEFPTASSTTLVTLKNADILINSQIISSSIWTISVYGFFEEATINIVYISLTLRILDRGILINVVFLFFTL